MRLNDSIMFFTNFIANPIIQVQFLMCPDPHVQSAVEILEVQLYSHRAKSSGDTS